MAGVVRPKIVRLNSNGEGGSCGSASSPFSLCYGEGREISSFFILAMRVLRFTPSLAAGPAGSGTEAESLWPGSQCIGAELPVLGSFVLQCRWPAGQCHPDK